MKHTMFIAGLLTTILFGQQAAAQSDKAAGQAEKDAMIRAALRAAPPSIAKTATVVDSDGNILRQGNGSFTCMSHPDPMCLDEQWLALGTAPRKLFVSEFQLLRLRSQ
jgi:hypothetical protein